MRLISTIMNFYWSHSIALQKLSNERSYKYSWILTLTEVINIRILRMRLISVIMNFYWSHSIALQKLSNGHSYKFSWILSLTEIISIRILRMRVISAIMNFYWSHSIALQKLSNERSYKFSWILTLTEVISIRDLRVFALAWNNCVHNLIKREVSREKLFATTDRQTDETAFQYSRLWVNNKQEAEAAWKLTTTVLRKTWHVNQIFELVL